MPTPIKKLTPDEILAASEAALALAESPEPDQELRDLGRAVAEGSLSADEAIALLNEPPGA